MRPVFSVDVWFNEHDPDNPDGECVSGEGDWSFTGYYAQVLNELRRLDATTIRFVELKNVGNK